MDLMLEGIVQATAVVSVCTLVLAGFLKKGYAGRRPSSVLIIWKILCLRLCVLYPLVYMSGIVSSFYDIFFKEEYADNVILVGDAWDVLPNSVNILGLNYVFAFWLAGLALFLLIHFYRYSRSVKMLLKGGSDAGRLSGLALRYGLEACPELERVKVIRSADIKSPMLAGAFRKILFMPDAKLEDGDMRMLLKHEIAHYARKDIALKLFFLFANALHWFNPLIYVMRKKAYEAIELCCDYEMIKDADAAERRSYAELMLYMLQNMSGLESAALGLSSRAAFLKNRLSAIMYTGKKKACVGLLVLTLAVMLVVQPFAYVDVYSEGFMDSYIEHQYIGEDGRTYTELIKFNDLYYSLEDGVVKPFSEEKEIAIGYGESINLYKSKAKEKFQIDSGDIIALHIKNGDNKSLRVKIGKKEIQLNSLSKKYYFFADEKISMPLELINYDSTALVLS